MEDLQDWIRAIEQTWIVRYPKQNLATFGITNIAYYVVTEPIYRDFEQGGQEGVVRKGRVLAEKPTIITPTYAMNLEGFRPEAYEYLKQISLNMGPQHPGILYKYKNEPENFEIVASATIKRKRLQFVYRARYKDRSRERNHIACDPTLSAARRATGPTERSPPKAR